MEKEHCSEMMVRFFQTIWHKIPEHLNLCSYHYGCLRFPVSHSAFDFYGFFKILFLIILFFPCCKCYAVPTSRSLYINTGWGIKISHLSKRYKIWKKPSRKKIEYISEKYITNSFLMGFKNQIRHKAAVVGNTLLKMFPEVLYHSLG